MPLDNATALKDLGKLVLIHTGPIPIEFTQLDNNRHPIIGQILDA